MTPEEGIRIGSIQIRYYGLIIVLAMLVAAWVAARLAKRDGRDPEHVWGALT
nr:prolipoprotein diacylglyceryl transferase [Anaerolineae bacterium]